MRVGGLKGGCRLEILKSSNQTYWSICKPSVKWNLERIFNINKYILYILYIFLVDRTILIIILYSTKCGSMTFVEGS